MMNGVGASGEVVTAGTALAGLILIYIGSIVTSFGSYGATEQKSVRSDLRDRAWLAFVGFLLSLLSAALGVIGKAVTSPCAGNVSVWFLMAAFSWTIFVTIQSIKGIK